MLLAATFVQLENPIAAQCGRVAPGHRGVMRHLLKKASWRDTVRRSETDER
jgi:hypothetical protein